MTALATNYQPGNTIPSAAFNSHALALKAQGIADDDAGKLILAASLDVPFGIVSSLNSVQTKAVGAGTTYTVASGKLFFIRSITASAAPGTALSIDPAGAPGAFTTGGTAGTGNAQPTGLCLGAGDAITTGTNTYLYGLLGTLPSAPSAPTRVLQEVNNGTSYTVPAGKVCLLTHAYQSTGSTAAQLTIDGIAAFYGVALFAVANTGTYPAWCPTYLAAGQIVAGSSASNWTISGLEYAI